MRLLQNKTNVDAPDSDYPFGRARNNPGNRTGTPVDEELLGDILQFFEKMFNASGLLANELPDNDYSGFQLYQAFEAIVTAIVTARATSGVFSPTISNTTNVSGSSTNNVQFMRVGNVVTVSGNISVIVTSNNVDTILELDLPIVSDFANSFQCAGTGIFDEGDIPVRVRANNGTNKARFEWTPPVGSSGNNRGIFFSFTYLIL